MTSFNKAYHELYALAYAEELRGSSGLGLSKEEEKGQASERALALLANLGSEYALRAYKGRFYSHA